ncbi:MaoC/PaaZ C-terminal domain-containing protein [Pseudoalteromonas sp. OOF1S-7]|uniref:MaoC/PaaZ C-terminal domain-containing protein n=1 Tax=Pseudoalteromonas sp. OOF1S-7 TaxID=2917757 RepID=UPI001EF6279C|nr:MaoC/PaaZ C-terminal domain-containing protein [Pseudoalteromonas sp. OOF1S-7]MCG7534487.1 hypothetical protein [Pseudoalteromonas sp. OOF1S-7]
MYDIQSCHLEFGSDQVKNWADFSGDFNPIHFDLDWAQRLGVENLVVHGMLAMLHLKQHLTEPVEHSPPEQETWHAFKAMICNPLPYNKQLLLAPVRKRQSLNYKGKCEASGADYFKGSIKWDVSKPDAWHATPVLSGKINVSQRLSSFKHHYRENFASWVVLDAIVFSEFMNKQAKPLRNHIAEQITSAFGEVPDNLIVVHGNHSVFMNATLLQGKDLADCVTGEVEYFIPEPELIVESNKIICLVKVLVKQGNSELMAVEMGLILLNKN